MAIDLLSTYQGTAGVMESQTVSNVVVSGSNPAVLVFGWCRGNGDDRACSGMNKMW